MSAEAAASAIRSHLRKALALSEDECDVEESGQPPAMAGSRYVAIQVQPTFPRDQPENAFAELYQCTITVTVRAQDHPADMHGTEVIHVGKPGLVKLGREIAIEMHASRYTIMGLMNTLLDSGSQPFIEPLEWAGNNPDPDPVDPSWFGSDTDDPSFTSRNPAGYKLDLNFSGLYRIQSTLGADVAN
jgi:hypothetical protein